MRVRKYRAFYEGKMIYNAERLGNALYWDNRQNFNLFAFLGFKPAILMDRLDVKDKNYRYVYEGDILKDSDGRVLLVEWFNCGFTLKAISETNFIRAYNIMQWFEGDTSRPEIIGNKFENPGLLNGVPA